MTVLGDDPTRVLRISLLSATKQPLMDLSDTSQTKRLLRPIHIGGNKTRCAARVQWIIPISHTSKVTYLYFVPKTQAKVTRLGSMLASSGKSGRHRSSKQKFDRGGIIRYEAHFYAAVGGPIRHATRFSAAKNVMPA